jgi:hypothetical protein
MERMTKRRLRLAVVTAVFALAFTAAGAFALPKSLTTYLVGPKMVRAEIALMSPELHDYRLSRGTIKTVSRTSITLTERDGQVETIPLSVAPATRVVLNGRPSGIGALRKRMQAVVVRVDSNTASKVFAASPNRALRLPKALANSLLGTRMLRAEIAVQAGSVHHDYLLDRGRIRSVSSATNSITLTERDGQVVTITVAADARITLNGQASSFAALTKRMTATTIRDGVGSAAQSVYAVGSR